MRPRFDRAGRVLLRAILAATALLLLFLLLGLRNAMQAPQVVEYHVELAGLPAGRSWRIVQLSDVHYGYPDMDSRHLLSVIRKANELKPDLVLLTGDYIDGKFWNWPKPVLENALVPLSGLSAPLGVYAVLGNHDEPYWTRRIMGQLRRPTLLVNEHVEAGPFAIAGLASTTKGADSRRALAGIPPGMPILLLLHEGDFLQYLTPPAQNPLLALSGHTHGGQVVLPLVGSLGDHWGGRPLCRRGLCTIRGWRLLVSSGLGTSVLPIRFGVPPEIVLLTVSAA